MTRSNFEDFHCCTLLCLDDTPHSIRAEFRIDKSSVLQEMSRCLATDRLQARISHYNSVQ